MTTNFCILRTAKLTAIGNIKSSASHNFRERRTDNADPKRTPENMTTGAQNAQAVVDGVRERLKTVPTIRKNGVLAIEYFFGASPEFFKDKNNDEINKYFDKCQEWLSQKHGAENVIAFTRQFDETSPHVCAYVVPIDDKGKLNASHFLDGRVKLSAMQTDFAENCGKPFNLERGIEGSTAKHTTVKQYYRHIQSQSVEPKTQLPRVDEPTFLQKIVDAAGLSNSFTEQKLAREKAEKARAMEIFEQRQIEQAKSAAYELEKRNKEALKADLEDLRANAVIVRQIDLESVLTRLGCNKSSKDKNNWETPCGRLSLNGQKFFNHDLNKGGGGAIDLVMAQSACDYPSAVKWLSVEFGTNAVVSEMVATIKPNVEHIKNNNNDIDWKQNHAPSQQNWEHVKKYLVEKRGLAELRIEQLYERGVIYADKFKNAVFKLGSGGIALRGTTENQFKGVRGKKDHFKIYTVKDKSEIKNVAFVESCIDALSLAELGKFDGLIVATSGSMGANTYQLAMKYQNDGMKIYAAFDSDKGGDALTADLKYFVPDLSILRPASKDWNDDLKSARSTPAERLALEKERQQEAKQDRSDPSMSR